MRDLKDIQALKIRLNQTLANYPDEQTEPLIIAALISLQKMQGAIEAFIDKYNRLFAIDEKSRQEAQQKEWLLVHEKKLLDELQEIMQKDANDNRREKLTFDLQYALRNSAANPPPTADQLQLFVKNQLDQESFVLIHELVKHIIQLNLSPIKDEKFKEMCHAYLSNCLDTLSQQEFDKISEDSKNNPSILKYSLKAIQKQFEEERVHRLKGLAGLFAPVGSRELPLLLKKQDAYFNNLDLKNFIEEIALLKIQHRSHDHFGKMCDAYIQACLNMMPQKSLTALKSDLESFQNTYERANNIGFQYTNIYTNPNFKSEHLTDIIFDPESKENKEKYQAYKIILAHVNHNAMKSLRP
ncbi:MAG: hypothetical protein A3F11_09065 [Gammaproteobacteria bacterium RIFCSPHIGHO2_12_FULL_37_14]|nr:MAG: hypothetical protein A3F11_09065 [Gammaproteobacteria bacterium RIFCSPHIGHO2_12_FULL_37_14]